jgi:hypothetical protein
MAAKKTSDIAEVLPLEETIKIQEALEPLGYDVLGFRKEKPHELVLYLDCTRLFKSHAVEDPSAFD